MKRSKKFEAKISKKKRKNRSKFYKEQAKHMWNGSNFALFRLWAKKNFKRNFRTLFVPSPFFISSGAFRGCSKSLTNLYHFLRGDCWLLTLTKTIQMSKTCKKCTGWIMTEKLNSLRYSITVKVCTRKNVKIWLACTKKKPLNMYLIHYQQLYMYSKRFSSKSRF